jgi:hypothetical protein
LNIEGLSSTIGDIPKSVPSCSADGVGIANNIGNEVILSIAAIPDANAMPALFTRLLSSENLKYDPSEPVHIKAVLTPDSDELNFITLAISLALAQEIAFTIFSTDRKIGVTATTHGRITAFGERAADYEHILIWVKKCLD